MMFTAALPLVFVTLTAIYFQPVAAQGETIFHVLRSQLRIFAPTASKSTLMYFDGLDNNGVGRVSTVYVDETEGFPIEELRDDKNKLTGCKYTAKVHDGFYTLNPKPAYLMDNNCAIRNAPNVKNTYTGIGTFEVVFDEGKIRYEVQRRVYPTPRSYLRLYKPLPNQDSIDHVSNAVLTVYIADAAATNSTTLLLEGQDQNGVNRKVLVNVEEKQGRRIYQITRPQGQVGLCVYPATQYDGVSQPAYQYAFVPQSCTIKDAPRDQATYQDRTFFELNDGGLKIRFKVTSVILSNIDEL